MNTLIYKRTHRGDPDKFGTFGIHDCMGKIRGWNFNAVIGIGGKKPWHNHEDIAFKINWIGINSSKIKSDKFRGPLVKFERFVLLDESGPDVRTLAPNLFKYMYEDRHVRSVMSKTLPKKMQKEIAMILGLIENRSATQSPVSSKKISTKQRC